MHCPIVDIVLMCIVTICFLLCPVNVSTLSNLSLNFSLNFNPGKMTSNVNCIQSSYCTINTLHLGYKNQSVNVV